MRNEDASRMDQTVDNGESSHWSRKRTARFLAIGICWLDSVIYLLGGTAIHLLVAVSFAVASIGLLKWKRWAEFVAISSVVTVSLYEFLTLVAAPRLWIANLVRLGLQVLLVYLILASRGVQSGGQVRSKLEMRGTV